jgi:hypothetical protein
MSSLPELFSNRDIAPRCPKCSQKLELNSLKYGGRSILQILLVIAAFGIFLILLGESEADVAGYLLINLTLFVPAVLYLFILPHEMAHVLATWLLGGSVFELQVGVGKLRLC